MVDVIKQIAGMPLFAGLSKAQYEALARIGVRRSFRKGERIFSEGDEGTGFYMVCYRPREDLQGLRRGEGADPPSLRSGGILRRGVRFYRSGISGGCRRLAQTTLLFFPRLAFSALIQKDPALALNMLAQLSRRLRHFAGLIEDLSLKEVPGRLAKYLLYLSGRDGDGEVASGRFQGAARVAPGDDPRDPLPDSCKDAPAGIDPLTGGADPDPRPRGASNRSPWRERCCREM